MSNLSVTTRYPQAEDSILGVLQRTLANRVVRTTAVALASAARTTTTQSADIDCTGYSSVFVFISCSVASGTGGLKLKLRAFNAQASIYHTVFDSSWTILSTDAGYLICGIGVGSNAQATLSPYGSYMSAPLPQTIRVEVTHGDASSYTYQVGYVLVP